MDTSEKSIEDLDLSNCSCSAYHTCQWCHEHADILLSNDRFGGGSDE
jgi:hypothetical protein